VNSLRAGFLYFLPVFALGFVLGTIRVLWLAPQIGAFPATLVELPIMLGASWFISKRLVSRFRISATMERLAMGAVAFVLLMISETVLGLAFGRSLVAQWQDLQTPQGLTGLAGQTVFGLMPLLAGMAASGSRYTPSAPRQS
jgi:hypothetical protein